MPNKLCMICLDSVQDTNNITLPTCNHILHSSCFCEYIQMNAGFEIKCPVCRTEILCVYPHIIMVPVQDIQVRPAPRVGFWKKIKNVLCFLPN